MDRVDWTDFPDAKTETEALDRLAAEWAFIVEATCVSSVGDERVLTAWVSGKQSSIDLLRACAEIHLEPSKLKGLNRADDPE